MQEGTVAFLSMVKITAAVVAHKAAGLPFLVYLRHPTTGGVFASWGSLGHVTVAEPDSLIGFLGPRVFEQIYDREFPAGVQSGENLQRHGIIDAVLGPDRIHDTVARVLDVLMGAREIPERVPDPDSRPSDVDERSAWDVITASRRPERPGVRDLLRHGATHVLPLRGTGQGVSASSGYARPEIKKLISFVRLFRSRSLTVLPFCRFRRICFGSILLYPPFDITLR